MQNLTLPVPSLKCQQPMGEPEVCDDVSRRSDEHRPTCDVEACWKPAKRIGSKVSSIGRHVKCSMKSVSWRLILPTAAYREVLVEVQYSVRGRRCVLVNGQMVLDQTKPLSKRMNIAGKHSFNILESDDGSFELFVDGVPFDEIDLWPRCDATPKMKTEHGQKTPKAKNVNSKRNVTPILGLLFSLGK